MNAGVVALASLTALLLPSPTGWPSWVPISWWVSAGVLSGVIWEWWWLAQRREEDEDQERRVAALSLASLPLLWLVFAVIAFWAGYFEHGMAFVVIALGFAFLGYALQPTS